MNRRRVSEVNDPARHPAKKNGNVVVAAAIAPNWDFPAVFVLQAFPVLGKHLFLSPLSPESRPIPDFIAYLPGISGDNDSASLAF